MSKNNLPLQNYKELLNRYLKPGDLFLDLAWNIDTCRVIEWCHDNNVLYVNTSIEEWEPYIERSPAEFTLYYRHERSTRVLLKGGAQRAPLLSLIMALTQGLFRILLNMR